MSRFNAKSRIKKLKEFDYELLNVLETKKDSTLLDYVEWYGAFGFDVYPFSDADALVLSLIIYFDLEYLLGSGSKSALLKDFYGPFKNGFVPLRITGGDMGNAGVMEAAIKSKRFGELVVSDYTDILSTSPALQFSAATFTFPGTFTFVAFRGTDSSVSGWKENFMISFTRSKAQELACDYAKKIVSRSGSAFYVGGHSKGGNLALSAALSLDGEALSQVKRIFILDGPGISPDMIAEEDIRRINEKTLLVLPEYDVVGSLFPLPFTNRKIVKSFRSGITEHSLPSWLIEHGRLSEASELSKNSQWISKLVTDWILGLGPDKREGFVNELFGHLEAEGVKDINELSPDELSGIIIRIIKKENSSARLLTKIPEKIVFDGIFEDLNKERSFTERHFKVILPLLFLAVALIMILASSRILEIVSLGIAFTMTLLQIILTIRHIADPHDSKEGIKERLLLTAAAIGSTVVLIVKEQALFILGSLIFAMLFFALSFATGDRIRKEKNRFLKVIEIIETILWSLAGISFLLLPEAWIKPLSIISGSVLALFAVIRLIHTVISYIDRKKNGKL